jgi:putative PIN family toxin of toxin-antitoxin system
MRVVYDTSVLATIVSRRDLIVQLQAAVTDGSVSLVTSLFIVNELERVLWAKFGMTKQGAKSRARLLARVAEVVHPEPIEQASRDANDDPILATAITGHAAYIVTFDDDLLVLVEHQGIWIVTPDDFHEALARA